MKIEDYRNISYRDVTVWDRKDPETFSVRVKSIDTLVEKYLNLAILGALGVPILVTIFKLIIPDVPSPYTIKVPLICTLTIYVFLPLTGVLLGAYKARDLIKAHLLKIDPYELDILNRLGDVIHEQRLYYKNNNRIESSVCFNVRFKDNLLIVECQAGGSGLVDDIRELDRILEDKLNMELRSKVKKLNTITYRFLMHKENRLVLPVKIDFLNQNLIPITESINWDINKTPHALVAGGTGGGKSYFLFYLIYVFLSLKYQVYICDPKRSDLYMSRNILERFGAVTEYSEGGIARSIRLVNEEMKRRYKEMNEQGDAIGRLYVDCNFKPVFLIIDEFGSFLAGCDRKVKTEVLNQLRQIIFQGRQAGVFVILATQKPDADTIPTEIRDQLDFRVVLGNLSQDGYRMVFGSVDNMDYKTNPSGAGYLYFNSIKSSNPVRFRAPLIDDISRIFEYIGNEDEDDMFYSGGREHPIRYPY